MNLFVNWLGDVFHDSMHERVDGVLRSWTCTSLWWLFLTSLGRFVWSRWRHAFFSGTDWRKLEARKVASPLKPVVDNELDVCNFDEIWTSMAPTDSPVQSDRLLSTLMPMDPFLGYSYESPGTLQECAELESNQHSAKFCGKWCWNNQCIYYLHEDWIHHHIGWAVGHMLKYLRVFWQYAGVSQHVKWSHKIVLTWISNRGVVNV